MPTSKTLPPAHDSAVGEPGGRTARPRLPFDNPALYRDCDADAEVFACAELVSDHPSCIDGAPYWRVTAVIPDAIAAKRWAGHAGIIIKMPAAEAQAIHRRGRLPAEFVGRAEVA